MINSDGEDLAHSIIAFRFQNDTREMTVLWHQSLLAFCQRYKTDMSDEQKDSLMELVKVCNIRYFYALSVCSLFEIIRI